MERADVCVIGGGVVGVAAALALARRGADVLLLEAQDDLGLDASGTNSGVLHTGFDATPGELETVLIRRSAALRPAVLQTLQVPVLTCGARMRPRSDAEREAVAALAAGAVANGVPVHVEEDGTLVVPGEWVTDPVAHTLALAAAARAHGARVRTGVRVAAVRPGGGGLELRDADGSPLANAGHVLNAAGLYADDLAAAGGDPGLFTIRPRKGEFLVFDPPGGVPLDHIDLPVPDARTKGVLLFPTLDGKVVAGPTAHDGSDKEDWSVREQGVVDILRKVVPRMPALAGAEPVYAYAGLRPAGADGANYVFRPSLACPGLLHVGAIRSTGLSACLGIAEYVCALFTGLGLDLGEEAPLQRGDPPASAGPWWKRTAEHRARP